jgi:hypothetical protein
MPSEAGPSTYYYYQPYFNAGRADADAQAGPSSSRMNGQMSSSTDNSHPRGPRQSTEPTLSGRSSEWVTVPSQAGPRSSDNDSHAPNPIIPIIGLPSPAPAARGNAELRPSSTSPPPPSSWTPPPRTPGPRELPYPPSRPTPGYILSPFMAPGSSHKRREKDILRDEELRGSSSLSPASSGEFVGGFKFMKGMKAAYKGVMRRPPRRDAITHSPDGLPQYSTTDPRLQPQTLPPEEQGMYVVDQDMHPSPPSVNFVDTPTRHPSAVTRQSIAHTHSSPQSHEHTVRSSMYDPLYVDHTSPHLSRAGTLQFSQGAASHREEGEEEEEGDETPIAPRRPPFLVENFQHEGGMPPSEGGTLPTLQQPPTILTTGPAPTTPLSAHLRPASSYTKMSTGSSARSHIGSFRDLPSFLRALWNLPWFSPDRVTVDWVPSSRRRQRRRPQSWYTRHEADRSAQEQWLMGLDGHPQLIQYPGGYIDARLLNSAGMLSVPLAAAISPMQQQQLQQYQQYQQYQRDAGTTSPPPVSEMGELNSPGMYSVGVNSPPHRAMMAGGGGMNGNPENMRDNGMLSPMSQMQQPRPRMVTVTDYPYPVSRQRTATPSQA